MSIPALELAHVSPASQKTLGAVQASLGVTPNMFRVAANSPAALDALVQMSGALAKGNFNVGVRESIALAVAQVNGCDYCLSAHTALGKGTGLSETDIAKARAGDSPDARVKAMISLSADIVRAKGRIGSEVVTRAKEAGVTDGDVVEIVATVALNVFTNYLNIVAQTDIDFPVVHASELVAI